MTNPTIKEHNVETGEVIERELTAKEITEYNAQMAHFAQREAEAKAKAAARQAVLDKLGLTAEEMAALLP